MSSKKQVKEQPAAKPSKLPGAVISILRRRIKEMDFASDYDFLEKKKLLGAKHKELLDELQKRIDKAALAAHKRKKPSLYFAARIDMWHAHAGMKADTDTLRDDKHIVDAVNSVCEQFEQEMNAKYGFAKPEGASPEEQRAKLLRELDDLVISTSMQDKVNQNAALQAFMDKLDKLSSK